MNTILEKAFNTLKDFAGYNALQPNMRSNNDPLLPANKPHGDQENQTRVVQEDATPDGRGITHQVEEAANAHVSEDLRTSSSRDRTDLNLHKSPVEVHREPRNPDTRPGAEQRLSSNTRSQSRSLADENSSLKMQLDTKQRDLARAAQQSRGLQRRLEGEKEELIRRNMEAVRDLQGRNKKLEEELKMLKGTLRGVQEKHLHTVKLLEERTADLKGAQTFLTTTDRYAGAEIMKMVEALNAEIFQGAALISELLEDETTILKADEQRKEAKRIQDAKDWVAQYIGRELAEHLSTESKQVQVDPLPLQLAVQAVLTSWCIFMIDSFCVGPARDDLREIYRRIWESEPQAVAGRWRAMMMGQAKHLDSTTNKDVVIKVLSNLLYLCGSPIANLNSQKTGLCLQQVVSTIIDMWMQLRTAIHEGITTTDMQVFGANPNDTFQDALMSNIYAGAGDVRQADLGNEAERILCVVGMGLQRFVIKRNGDGTISLQKDITLKARVVFPSVLFEQA